MHDVITLMVYWERESISYSGIVWNMCLNCSEGDDGSRPLSRSSVLHDDSDALVGDVGDSVFVPTNTWANSRVVSAKQGNRSGAQSVQTLHSQVRAHWKEDEIRWGGFQRNQFFLLFWRPTWLNLTYQVCHNDMSKIGSTQCFAMTWVISDQPSVSQWHE